MGTPLCACSRVSALTVPSTWRVSSSRQLQGWHLHFITVSTQRCSPQWGLPAHPIPDYISTPTLVFSISPLSYIFSSKTFIIVKWVYNYSFIYYLTPPGRVHFSWELESVCFVLYYSPTHGRACSLFLNEWTKSGDKEAKEKFWSKEREVNSVNTLQRTLVVLGFSYWKAPIDSGN